MLTDDEMLLLTKAASGDAQAFEMLVQEHQARIYGLCLRMMGNPDDAMDAVQETMIRAFVKLHTFKQRAQFSTWLYRIASNICLDMLRRKKRRDTLSMDSLEESGEWLPDSMECLPEENTLRREEKRQLEGALLRLSPHHRLVLVLREVQGFSYEEIAKMTRTTMGTVKSRIFRARKDMQIHLNMAEQSNYNSVKEDERSGMLL